MRCGLRKHVCQLSWRMCHQGGWGSSSIHWQPRTCSCSLVIEHGLRLARRNLSQFPLFWLTLGSPPQPPAPPPASTPPPPPKKNPNKLAVLRYNNHILVSIPFLISVPVLISRNEVLPAYWPLHDLATASLLPQCCLSTAAPRAVHLTLTSTGPASSATPSPSPFLHYSCVYPLPSVIHLSLPVSPGRVRKRRERAGRGVT